jgi:anti-repressor protein
MRRESMGKSENQLIPFASERFGSIRIWIDDDGTPWWVVADVCRALGLSNVGQALSGLDTDERRDIILNDVTGRRQEMAIVSESGLYSLILRSRKPEAKAFKRWVTHEVLPSIRKTGAFISPEKAEEILYNPDFIIGLATELKTARAAVAERDEKIARDAPLVEASRAFLDSGGCITFGDMAVILRGHGRDIGRTRLMEQCRAWGLLLSELCRWNLPSQDAAERGLLVERQDVGADGRSRRFPMITKKGQMYLLFKYFPNGVMRPLFPAAAGTTQESADGAD